MSSVAKTAVASNYLLGGFAALVLLQLWPSAPFQWHSWCPPSSSLCSSAHPSPYHVWFTSGFRQQSWRPPVRTGSLSSELKFHPFVSFLVFS